MKKIVSLLSLAAALFVVSCDSGDYVSRDEVLVLCQGSYSGNGSVTQYKSATKAVEIDYYQKANNGLALGNMPMSLTVYNNILWIPIKSSVIGVDPFTGKYKTRIPNLSTPSTITPFNGLYFITDAFKPEIVSYNTQSNKFVDTITLSGPVNRIAEVGGYLYANQWSYGTQILKIDPRRKYEIVDSVDVGIQPNTLLVDQLDEFWTITDGGYPGNPLGDVAPEIVKVANLNNKLTVTKRFALTDGPNYQLFMSTLGSRVYLLAGDKVFMMFVDANKLSTTPVIEVAGANFSSFVEDPFTGDIYVGDAGNWVDNGTVYRYDRNYKLLDSFETGSNPIAFCFVK